MLGNLNRLGFILFLFVGNSNVNHGRIFQSISRFIRKICGWTMDENRGTLLGRVQVLFEFLRKIALIFRRFYVFCMKLIVIIFCYLSIYINIYYIVGNINFKKLPKINKNSNKTYIILLKIFTYNYHINKTYIIIIINN